MGAARIKEPAFFQINKRKNVCLLPDLNTEVILHPGPGIIALKSLHMLIQVKLFTEKYKIRSGVTKPNVSLDCFNKRN